MPVRILTVRGGNEQIGAYLAGLGHSDHATRIARYGDPIYAQARRTYLEGSHPTLAVRARGVADAFGIPVDVNEFVTAAVGYDVPGRPACSAMWCPPVLTTNDTR
ncbi:hypothetical protein ACIRRA_05475 [Nocardia sp. NPDC101769]|uniref:hypothetical protein n=1 Tax=Nocardia sp. NPDC101769 TaxID=3364333 RepID=UPI0037F862EB